MDIQTAGPHPMTNIPVAALSVRQPWAWAIIYGGKDIENRTAVAINKGSMRCQRIAIHASKGMTRGEYWDAHHFMLGIGVDCPPPDQLRRGGMIGSVDVIDIVAKSSSPWFFGPRGLVLANPKACDFVPAVGQLGYFRWKEADASIVPEPARWMLPDVSPPERNDVNDLFAQGQQIPGVTE